MNRRLSSSAALLAAVAFMLGFQNCGKANFSGSSSASVESAAVPTATATTSASATPTSTCTGDVLCTIDFSNISQISLIGTLDTGLVGTYGLKVTTVLNDSNDTFTASVAATGPISAITLASCNAAGSNVDFTDLESSLKAMTIVTSENSASPISDFASATLTFTLKDGTTKIYTVDTQTSSVSVSGVTVVQGLEVVEQLKNVALDSSCSTNLPF